MDSKYDILYENWLSASDKFDYFVLGLTGAVCAYIAKGFVPQKMSFTPNTVELIALTLLLVSLVFGFRRLEKSIIVHSVTFQLHSREELLQKLKDNPHDTVTDPDSGKSRSKDDEIKLLSDRISEAKSGRDKAVIAAERLYKWRNLFLFGGVFALLISKIWSAYTVCG